ncbi:hypothetical protein UFOVP496_25 [uncultured Caudovirales phage]|uniref:Uncharacterized protein n=1 Tax=uncultured Caudovirales phage TaxID=2100421 RepID=A0A6J5MJR4_9CAUD|nr:hypothetical protein UFOVP496_25 [uncultured Caudovirales phage]
MALPTGFTASDTINSYSFAVPITVAAPFTLCRAIYVGGAGNITAAMSNGDSVTFTAVPVGTLLPIRATNVSAATASAMVALY